MKTKHAVAARKRKRKVLDAAKGYWGDRSRKHRRASETLRRAGNFAYAHRRAKKRTFRSLWIVRINAAVKERGMAYRTFIHGLNLKKVALSRDILAKIAAEYPVVFDAIVDVSKQ